MKFLPPVISQVGARLRAVSKSDIGGQGSTPPNTEVSRRLTPLFIFSCSILALVKLWLVRHDEVPVLGSPFDDIWYLQSAKDWYWLRSYSELPFGTPPYVRLPVYPLYLALVNLTGIPLRIANELLFLLAAFVFAGVLIKAGQSRILGVLCFAAITFHPATFIFINLAYPDSLYAPVLLFSVAGLILTLIKRDDAHRFGYALATGIALAVLWHIRQESIVIICFFAVYALLWFLRSRWHSAWRYSWLRQFVMLVITPLLVIFVVSMVVKTANYARFGVFSGDAMFTDDFQAASKALVRIQPHPPIRFVSVPREVRQRAYAVSPAFKELESYFEGEPGRIWATFARGTGVQVPGEISGGHIWWGLNTATYYAGYNKSGRQAGRFYRRMAAEINAACDDGRLECRTVISALIDPERKNWVPYLGRSFFRVTHLFTTTDEVPMMRDMPKLPSAVRELADSVTNSRAALPTDGSSIPGPERAIQSFIWLYHGKVVTLLTYAGLFAIVLLLIFYRSLDLKDSVFSISILLLSVVGIRVGMVTFIDASWWEVDQLRYIFPVLYLYTCLLLMLIGHALRLAASSISRNQAWLKIRWNGLFHWRPDRERS